MTKKTQLTFERSFNAPVSTIWKACTDPEIIKQWWGPDNVLIPECTVDFKVGGEVYIVMEASEAMGEYQGTRWPLKGKFTVIEENNRFIYEAKSWTEGLQEETEIDQVSEFRFSEISGQTRLQINITINKIGPSAGGAVDGIKYGYNKQLDKLDNLISLGE